jgi:hypothetical protein
MYRLTQVLRLAIVRARPQKNPVPRKVKNKCAHVYYFEMQFLEILIDKIAHIAQSIMADAKRMEKEVGT